ASGTTATQFLRKGVPIASADAHGIKGTPTLTAAQMLHQHSSSTGPSGPRTSTAPPADTSGSNSISGNMDGKSPNMPGGDVPQYHQQRQGGIPNGSSSTGLMGPTVLSRQTSVPGVSGGLPLTRDEQLLLQQQQRFLAANPKVSQNGDAGAFLCTSSSRAPPGMGPPVG
ncbi:unnamed protein product, partial [Amoebophrya sp. A25]